MLSLLFLLIFAFAFFLVVWMLRTPPNQQAIDRRMALVLTPSKNDSSVEPVPSNLAPPKAGMFPWLDEALRGTAAGDRLQRLILQSHYETSSGPILIVMALLMVFSFVISYWLTAMLIVAAAIAIAFGFLPLLWLRQKREKHLAKFNAALPDCIDMCGRALRAGHSMIGAIAMVAEEAVEPAATEFSEVFKKHSYGLPLRDALMQMLERVPSSDLQVFVTGILVQKDTGGNLAEILDRIVFVIRERIRIQGDIRTHTAQGRLTGWILSLLPIGMLVLINLVNPGYSRIMFHDPLGRELLYAGFAMMAVGALVIRRIINGIEV